MTKNRFFAKAMVTCARPVIESAALHEREALRKKQDEAIARLRAEGKYLADKHVEKLPEPTDVVATKKKPVPANVTVLHASRR